ncbi:MAG: rane protein [Myxococcaceae bacterium]|jgi:hypothetical protein|nr:rane protein [Myxococcaceae bacterium]
MFIGHYGAALAAKRWAPRVSLGWFFLAVQLLDVLFAGFVFAGVEKIRIVPGFTAYNPYDLYSMPYTHGLVGALGWSVLAGIVVALVARDRRVGIVFGACVFSHWLLDLPVHTPDMPLLGDTSTKLGLGLWNHPWLAGLAELASLAIGAWLWLRATPSHAPHARAITVAFLVLLLVFLVTTPFMPTPTSPNAFAAMALAGYGLLAFAAAWVDRKRR